MVEKKLMIGTIAVPPITCTTQTTLAHACNQCYNEYTCQLYTHFVVFSFNFALLHLNMETCYFQFYGT